MLASAQNVALVSFKRDRSAQCQRVDKIGSCCNPHNSGKGESTMIGLVFGIILPLVGVWMTVSVLSAADENTKHYS
jgi:hypothetical protein